MVEILFLPSVYPECPDCHDTRYKASTLEVTWRGQRVKLATELQRVQRGGHAVTFWTSRHQAFTAPTRIVWSRICRCSLRRVILSSRQSLISVSLQWPTR